MLCPCKSQQEFSKCCGLYIKQDVNAPTAEALMRSRYTAYTLADVNYLKKTWAPQNCPPLNPVELKQTRWVGLKIIAKEKGESGDDTGIVEFIAYYKAPNGKVAMLRERSQFYQKDGAWFYLHADK